MKKYVFIVAKFIIARIIGGALLPVCFGVVMLTFMAATGGLGPDYTFNVWPLVYVMGAIAAACYAAVGAR